MIRWRTFWRYTSNHANLG